MLAALGSLRSSPCAPPRSPALRAAACGGTKLFGSPAHAGTGADQRLCKITWVIAIFFLFTPKPALVTRKIEDAQEMRVALGSLAPSSPPLPRTGALFAPLTLKYKILSREADASSAYAEEQQL